MPADPIRDPAPEPGRTSGSALERVRRANLSRVLRLVHEDGTTARSAITRATGLNRSTVGALVGELVRLGLVVEGDPVASSAVGRPSPTVTAAHDVVAFAANPEIDALTVAVVGLDGTEWARVRHRVDTVPTPQEASRELARIVAELRHDLPDGARVAGLGVAVPGIVRADDGMVRNAPHLGWRDEPFAARLADATGLRVSAANDANLGVRAEQLYGSARGRSHVVYVNGGASGIGGGLVVDGRALGGRDGHAGELGHTFVDGRELDCHCGSRGCLETVVAQSLLLRAAGLGPTDADLLQESLASPAPELAAEVDRQLTFLARALRDVVLTTDPELVVLGGFLGALHEVAGDRIEELVAAQTRVVRDGVAVTRTRLGSAILLRGAAELVLEPLIADPVGAADELVPAHA